MNTTTDRTDFTTREIEASIARARTVDMGQAIRAILDKNPGQLDLVQYLAKWSLEGLIEAEVQRNLWLQVAAVSENHSLTILDAFVEVYGYEYERAAEGYSDDKYSGRTNDSVRVAADATRAWLRNHKHLNTECLARRAEGLD